MVKTFAMPMDGPCATSLLMEPERYVPPALTASQATACGCGRALGTTASSEAGASSQWHGIRSHVRKFDGRLIEAIDTVDDIMARLAKNAEAHQ